MLQKGDGSVTSSSPFEKLLQTSQPISLQNIKVKAKMRNHAACVTDVILEYL